MKTEQQLVDRLEEVVAEVERLCSLVKDDEEPTEEVKVKLGITFGSLLILAWTLDCESELRPLILAVQAKATADRISGDK